LMAKRVSTAFIARRFRHARDVSNICTYWTARIVLWRSCSAISMHSKYDLAVRIARQPAASL